MQLVLEDEEQSAAESDAAKDAAEPSERWQRIEVANRNRGALQAHLPRYEVDIENKACPRCGGALHVIGDDRTEMLDLVPAQLRVAAEGGEDFVGDGCGEVGGVQDGPALAVVKGAMWGVAPTTSVSSVSNKARDGSDQGSTHPAPACG